MLHYSKSLSRKYTERRDHYRSPDVFTFKTLRKVGIKGKTILDFGCGDGRYGEDLLKMGAEKVIGVDPSRGMIDLAKKRYQGNKNFQFKKSDGKTIPLPTASVDLVFANFVMHYIKDTMETFGEMYRVLKPGGYFIAICNGFDLKKKNEGLENSKIQMQLGFGENTLSIEILIKTDKEFKDNIIRSGLVLVSNDRVSNPDAHVRNTYPHKKNVKIKTRIWVAQKKNNS